MKLRLRTWFIIPMALVAVALGSSACAEDEPLCGPISTSPGPLMRPGENCLGCHYDGFGDPTAPPFTAAGTVMAAPDSEWCEGVEGVTVTLQAEDGSDLVLTTNAAGNFYTSVPLMAGGNPSVDLDGRTGQMFLDLPDVPACNACHSNPPVGGAPGHIYVP